MITTRAPDGANKFKFLLKLCCKTNDHLWQVEYDGVGDDWNNEGAGRELLPKGGNFILFCSVFGLIVLHSVCCWFLFFYNISDLDRD